MDEGVGRFLSFLTIFVAATAVEIRAGSSAVTRSSAQAPNVEGTLLRRKIIAAIKDNYRRIPVAHCKIVSTILDPNVKEHRTVRQKLPNGGLITFEQNPRVTIEMELIAGGSNFRVDCVHKETGAPSSSAMHDGIWTDYSPRNQWAARWYRADMGGVNNFDPRNIGASTQKEVFLEELAGDRVARHETVKTEHSEWIALDMERFIPAIPATIKYRCEFDPRLNYLPRRIIHYDREKGQIVSVLDIEYQEVVKGSAWFLKKSTQRFFAIRHAQTPDDKGWTQQMTTEVGPIRTDETFADRAFEIPIAPGIQLRDNTRWRNRAAAQVDDSPSLEETVPGEASPVVNRILSAWKARQERLRSLHFTWKGQLVLPQGARFAGRRITKEITLDIPPTKFWGVGENRLRAEFRKIDIDRWPIAPGKQIRGTLDGSADVTLELSDTPGGAPRGFAWSDGHDHESRASLLRPLLLACWPATPKATGPHPEHFQLLTENAILDNRHCIKIQKRGKPPGELLETCWIDPDRDDVIVRWEIGRPGTALFWASIDYRKDRDHGWLPAGWKTNLWSVADQPNEGVLKATVTKLAINETFPPDTFATAFTEDTIVPETTPRHAD